MVLWLINKVQKQINSVATHLFGTRERLGTTREANLESIQTRIYANDMRKRLILVNLKVESKQQSREHVPEEELVLRRRRDRGKNVLFAIAPISGKIRESAPNTLLFITIHFGVV